MKTEIIRDDRDWEAVVDCCRSTVGLKPLGHEPGGKFKRDILIAEHSPIRELTLRWRWSGIKSWIATHFSRHKWECYITTQRTDRTGIERDELPQGMPVDFVGSANAQHLIDTMRKRLCGQASAETREYAEDLKDAIGEKDKELAGVLVPNCIYRCGCPELKCCGLWQRFAGWAFINGATIKDIMDIGKRYELYRKFCGEGGND